MEIDACAAVIDLHVVVVHCVCAVEIEACAVCTQVYCVGQDFASRTWAQTNMVKI